VQRVVIERQASFCSGGRGRGDELLWDIERGQPILQRRIRQEHGAQVLDRTEAVSLLHRIPPA